MEQYDNYLLFDPNREDDNNYVKLHLDEYVDFIKESEKEVVIKKDKIKKRKLNEEKDLNLLKKIRSIKTNGLKKFIAGTTFAVALAVSGMQIKGNFEITDETSIIFEGYYFEDDSEKGNIVFKNNERVSYNDAISDIIEKGESKGFTKAEIDIALRDKGVNQSGLSSVTDRFYARGQAFENYILNKEKGMTK